MNAISEAKPTVPIKRPEMGRTSPIYIWRTGRTIFPSKKERAVAEIYVSRLRELMETGKSMGGVYWDCVEALKGMGVVRGAATVKRWLERGNVKDWMEEQLKSEAVDQFWTKERWLMVMTDHLAGKKRLANGDLYGMGMIAKVKHFEMPESVNFNNIQITQADGRA